MFTIKIIEKSYKTYLLLVVHLNRCTEWNLKMYFCDQSKLIWKNTDFLLHI